MSKSVSLHGQRNRQAHVQIFLQKVTQIESDADRIWRSLIEVLEVSVLVDWQINIWPAYHPKIRHLDQQGACATLCQRCFVSLYNCVTFWLSICIEQVKPGLGEMTIRSASPMCQVSRVKQQRVKGNCMIFQILRFSTLQMHFHLTIS